MKRLAQLQRPVRVGEVRAYNQRGELVQIAPNTWLQRGPSFSKLFLSFDTSDDVLLTAEQANKLENGKPVYAQLRGSTALLELVDA